MRPAYAGVGEKPPFCRGFMLARAFVVRRGSTVRVRQRASKESRISTRLEKLTVDKRYDFSD